MKTMLLRLLTETLLSAWLLTMDARLCHAYEQAFALERRVARGQP